MAWIYADWTWPVLSPFLSNDDTLSVSLFAMEMRHRSLWRFFVYEDTCVARRPHRGKRTLDVAVANGCWRAATTIHEELLRGRYDGGRRDIACCDLSTLKAALAKHSLRVTSSMASFLRRMHFAPVAMSTHVMYEACHRGHLDAVTWLHEVTLYDPHLAIEWAAKGKHMDIVRWVLTHRKTAQLIRDGIKITWTLKGKEAKAIGGFYAWNVHVPDDRTTYAYCGSRAYGLLPRKNVKHAKTLYPLKTWAATEGNLALFETLHEHASGRDMSTTEAVVRAADGGHLAIVEWFFEIERPVHKDIEDVMLAALSHGHLHIVQWLYEQDLEMEIPMASRLAVRANGSPELHEWIEATFPDPALTTTMRNQRTPQWDNYLIEAASNGLLEVVSFLHEDVGCAISIRALGDAASHGHLEVLQWLWAKQPPDDRDLRFVLARAVAGGSLHVVRWLVADVGLFESSLLKLAVNENRVDVAAYLFGVAQENAARNQISVAMVFDFHIDFVQLITEGCFDAVDWLLSNALIFVLPHQDFAKYEFFLTLERYHDENEAALGVRNTEYEHKRLFQWASAMAQPRAKVVAVVERLLLAIPAETCQQFEWIPKWAMKIGSKKVLQALVDMQHGSVFWYRNLSLLLQSTRDVSLVQWYLQQEGGLSLVEEETTRIVRWAATHTHVDLLQWIFSRSEELSTFRTAAWTAAKHDHVNILHTIARYIETHGLAVHTEFCRRIWQGIDSVAAEHGHVDVIDWMWTRTKTERPLGDVAVKWGQLRVLQWLIHKNPHMAQCSVRAFCCAVGKGHAEIVCWLTRHQPCMVARAMDAIPSLQVAVQSLLTEWKTV